MSNPGLGLGLGLGLGPQNMCAASLHTNRAGVELGTERTPAYALLVLSITYQPRDRLITRTTWKLGVTLEGRDGSHRDGSHT